MYVWIRCCSYDKVHALFKWNSQEVSNVHLEKKTNPESDEWLIQIIVVNINIIAGSDIPLYVITDIMFASGGWWQVVSLQEVFFYI